VKRSTLNASRAEVWQWISSFAGTLAEMSPYYRISVPRGVHGLADVNVTLGSPFMHSRVYAFGVIPLGVWHFTLVELDHEDGFVEQSPSTVMSSWRHERRIVDVAGDPSAVEVVDHVTSTPKFGAWLVRPFLRRLFDHRHQVLQKQFNRPRELAASARPLSVPKSSSATGNS
jgi:ligand-binding SRPBCC domain-containing protein